MTLAELKRDADKYVWTMTRHCMKTCKLIGLARKVLKKQTNAIKFEPTEPGQQGSWLWWPKASEVVITGMGDVKYVSITEYLPSQVLVECMAYELVPIQKGAPA